MSLPEKSEFFKDNFVYKNKSKVATFFNTDGITKRTKLFVKCCRRIQITENDVVE